MATIGETLGPPRERIDPLRWVRQNLFNSWYNGLLTLLALALLAALLRSVLTWALSQADWAVVAVNLRLLMVGTFPSEQIWRVWLCVLLAATLLGLSWGLWPNVARAVGAAACAASFLMALLPFAPTSRGLLALCGALILGGMIAGRRLSIPRADGTGRRAGAWVAGAWLLLLPLVIYLLRGGLVLPAIPTSRWGGLLLTLLLAIVAIVFSFPLGVLLAIGRRSSLPVIRLFCTLYIELIRGVPLITVLFMMQIMLPLFVPGGESIDNVARAMVGFTIFTAAYIAENVRGGLQAIPRGQEEAARALGLNPLLTMGMIVLPQALRIVIPANVGQFISLFKDTSLVAVAGLLDLLGIARSVLAQSEFLGRQSEVLLFVALVYWVFAYSLTYVSRRLEEALGVGQR
ncbi:MAG: amino acid ABC transporter permease [Chloroflexota bacterium]